ncbi:Protein of unknown function [Marininema mesophilum]|uniref:DUF2953 domain-containing protein n=1 Tax=Marininema mesophilum TaxID=1048340 RepID=A0A1H2UJJ6_9BACL|nr:DUF2953 domain-containing protein [Marininema mesophilum]SDW56356.1 Protein of unknown function [Marininema mesophilum]
MSWWLILGIIVAVFLCIIPFTSVRIRLVYRRQGEDDSLSVHIGWLWGLVRYRWQASQVEWNEEGIQVRENAKSNLPTKGKRFRERINFASIKRAQQTWRLIQENIVHLSDIIRKFIGHIVCEKLVWTSKLGTGDAAETGVITGLAWGIKSSLVGIIGSYMQWKKDPYLDVCPSFTEERLETDLECIVRFKVGHAIRTGVQLFLRMDKGGEGKWRNTLSKA